MIIGNTVGKAIYKTRVNGYSNSDFIKHSCIQDSLHRKILIKNEKKKDSKIDLWWILLEKPIRWLIQTDDGYNQT